MEKRPLKDLINVEEHAWSLVLEWLSNGRNKYQVLEVNRKNAGNVLYELQVTTRSPMGAIAFESGGILIDHGWVKILGSGSGEIYGDLLYWNGLGLDPIGEPLKGAMVVAYDVIRRILCNKWWGFFRKNTRDVLSFSRHLRMGRFTDWVLWLYSMAYTW